MTSPSQVSGLPIPILNRESPMVSDSERKESRPPSEKEGSYHESAQSEKDIVLDLQVTELPPVSAYLTPSNRKLPKWTLLRVIGTVIKIVFSLALVIALAVGYGLSIKVVDISVTSIGLYGTILVVDFIAQYSCAIINRWDVSRIAKKAKRNIVATATEGSSTHQEKQSTAQGQTKAPLMNPDAEVSIAVVGYREDEEAWKLCLRSLQKQTLTPKCIVGVVDGNDKPDLAMADSFMEEFGRYNSRLIHLPVLLSTLHRETYFQSLAQMPETRCRIRRWSDRICGRHSAEEQACLKIALETVLNQVAEWEAEFNISSYDAVCFSQPHGHKRTAMFTAFAMALYAIKTRHAVFTTDSDTLLKEDALDEMLTLLRSSEDIGGVTADVKIFNRSESFLARLCSIRYWFAFNIERACQSFWNCVGCLSGPMALYRSHDLHTILGLWNLQTFRGKETTFGDDRHLSNHLLAQGFKTRYTHRTWCESESPTTFVRWTIQQTRWSKSFFREAFWFPHAFTLQSGWMLIEITKQSLYPFILVATVFHMLFSSSTPLRPVIWLVTMFGVAFIKSILAFCMSLDPWLLLFTFYGFIYFFGLLPSKLYALLTMNKTTWGTSARSSTEIRRGQSFFQRFFHVGHLVLWYMATCVGLGFFFAQVFDNDLFYLISIAGVIPSASLFVEIPSPTAAFRRARQGRLARKTQSDQETTGTPTDNNLTVRIPTLSRPVKREGYTKSSNDSPLSRQSSTLNSSPSGTIAPTTLYTTDSQTPQSATPWSVPQTPASPSLVSVLMPTLEKHSLAQRQEKVEELDAEKEKIEETRL
ncbi:unnamed protein product [Sympodiomycopsis kandeliae]